MLLVYHTAARVSQELASKWQTPRLKNWASLEMTSLHFLGYKSNSVQHTLETANILFAFQAATCFPSSNFLGLENKTNMQVPKTAVPLVATWVLALK